MSIAWSAKLTPQALGKVIDICGHLGFPPDWLMACIAFESGRSFSPSARNGLSGATGLIQFMPSTARGMGTSVEALAQMSVEEQLDWVASYFKPYAGRINTLSDCYMVILWPSAVDKAEEYALFSKDDAKTAAYMQNRGLDLNGDGVVTKAEATAKVAKLLEEGYLPQNVTAAPIEERPVSPAPLQQPEEEPAMPSTPGIGAALTGIATAINPVAGLVVGLAGSLIDAFSPLAKEKLAKELGRHDIPPEVSGQVYDNIIEGAKAITGKTDAIAATAAALNDPDVLAKLEQQAIDKLNSMAPIFDKMNEYELAARAADEASYAAAATREGAEDLRPLLANRSFTIYCVLLCAVVILLGAQMYLAVDHKPSELLLGFLITLGTMAAKQYEKPFDYSFGTSRSSTAKDALIGELAKGKR